MRRASRHCSATISNARKSEGVTGGRTFSSASLAHSGSIGLRRATPGDQAYLFVSTGAQAFNGCGGMIPDLTGLLGPNGIFYSATVSDAGTAGFSYTLPPSATPINASLFMQWVVVDATNPFAIRLSDLRKVVLW